MKKLLSVILAVVIVLSCVPFAFAAAPDTIPAPSPRTVHTAVAPDGYEYALFPMDCLNISQGENDNYSHKGKLVIDNCGYDSGIDPVFAPFSGTIKAKGSWDSGNWVVLQSNNPVHYADGTLDYMTVMVAHMDNTSGLYVGQGIAQGQQFYQEGKAGNATGNHIELGVIKGGYQNWAQNSYGVWILNGQYHCFDGLYLPQGTAIYNSLGYNWRIVPDSVYTNSIQHWLWGFENGEGNNGCKNAFKIADSSFTTVYNTSFIMDESRAVMLPNGITANGQFATGSIEDIWKTYDYGTTAISKCAMGFEYYYDPITYNITYDLAGGTNHSDNPATYNVLYGVTLKNPTRTGYTFDGWYNGSTKVTGINQGKNATFANADELYAELAKRQTGDVKLTAKWTPITYTVTFDANGGENAPAVQTKTYGADLTLSTDKPTRDGYVFCGWATSSDAEAAEYYAGSAYSTDENMTLYAVWKEVEQKLIIMKKEMGRAYVNGGIYLTTDYGNGIFAKAMSTANGYVLPLRYIGENFGMAVEYINGQTRITNAAGEYLVVIKNNTTMNKYDANNNLIATFSIPVAPFTQDGVTYVPLRAVSEALDLGVCYVSSATTGFGSYVAISTDKNIDKDVNTVYNEIAKAHALGL